MDYGLNTGIGTRLDEIARLLEAQGANAFRVAAYRRAAEAVRALQRPIDDVVRTEGPEGLEALLGIGPALARTIEALVTQGRLPLLDRLREQVHPAATLASVPGIGAVTAGRLVHELGITTLEDLEAAAHDGRLARLGGFGDKRLAGIRDALAARLGRLLIPASSCQEVP